MPKYLLDTTSITILAVVSLDVERTAPSSNLFKIVISIPIYPYILAALSHDDERRAPSSIFLDEMDSP